MLFNTSICNMLNLVTFQREIMGKAGDEADVPCSGHLRAINKRTPVCFDVSGKRNEDS